MKEVRNYRLRESNDFEQQLVIYFLLHKFQFCYSCNGSLASQRLVPQFRLLKRSIARFFLIEYIYGLRRLVFFIKKYGIFGSLTLNMLPPYFGDIQPSNNVGNSRFIVAVKRHNDKTLYLGSIDGSLPKITNKNTI